MTPFTRICSAALLSMLLVSGFACAEPACVAPQNGGMGGTGAPLAVGGMGGTGAPLAIGGMGGTGNPQPTENGGFGGTGYQAGSTGILGTITGFGSVCVNGLEVQYDHSTPVSRNGDNASSDRLALGQVVAIVANGEASHLTAKSIAILEALSGPITGVENSELLQVMGQPVRITHETRLSGAERLSDLPLGAPVRVSGYRNAVGEVVASRIESASDLQLASVFGPVVTTREGQIIVGGVRTSAQSAPSSTMDWLVRGHWDGTVFQTNQPLIPLPFNGRVTHVVAEGLVLGHNGPGRLSISGFEVNYGEQVDSTKGTANVQVGQQVRVAGSIEEDGRLRASRVELIPLGASAIGGMSSGLGGAPSGNGMSSSTRMEFPAAVAVPQRFLPIVRPGSMGGSSGGHMGR